MAGTGIAPGTWKCNFCLRDLHESEFATDNWKKKRGRAPGRCQDCEKELARAKTALSPTWKFADADHRAAYHMAKDTCRNHAWGAGYYDKRTISAARERVKAQQKGRAERTLSERRADETELLEHGARRQSDRNRQLEAAAKQRATAPAQLPPPAAAPEDDQEAADRRARIRALRAARNADQPPPPPPPPPANGTRPPTAAAPTTEITPEGLTAKGWRPDGYDTKEEAARAAMMLYPPGPQRHEAHRVAIKAATPRQRPGMRRPARTGRR